MYLNHFEKTDMARLEQILSTLKNVHGIVMRFDLEDPQTEGRLFECIRQWDAERGKIVAESQFNTYQQNPDYIKSMLILEAARIMLKEIAPRRRRRKMNESDMSADKTQEPRKTSLSMQLSDIAARIPQWSDEASAFSNELAAMSDNIRYRQPLTTVQQEILDWLKGLPRPVTISAISDQGVERFGPQLATTRKSELEALPKIDMTKEGKDQDGDGDSDFADVMVARMTKSGMPKQKAIAKTAGKSYNKESAAPANPLSGFKRKRVPGLYSYDHFEDANGNWIQVRQDRSEYAYFDKATGKISSFASADDLKSHLAGQARNEKVMKEAAEMPAPDAPASMAQPEATVGSMPTDTIAAPMGKMHHYEYQASMARSELYRNAKYAMSMLQQVDPQGEVHPWIAGALTKAANLLDKVYHYLDYYKTFEPDKLPESHDDADLGETSGGVTRQNLMLITEYSTKLFDMIKPGDKLEGWVAMKLTTASEAVSCCKHYMDYVQFEKHAEPKEFLDKTPGDLKESSDPLAKKAAAMLGPRGVDRRDLGDDEIAVLKRVASGKYSGADRAKASKMITVFYRPDPKLPESVMESENLAKAATIIDAKNMAGKVQEIAEDLAEMSVEDLMPLVDIMRAQFGPEAAEGFNQSVKSVLTKLLDQAVQAKHTLDDAIDTLNKGGVPAEKTDLEKPEAPDEMQTDVADDTDIAKDLEALAGADQGAEAEPEADAAEPLGRAKKEEVAEAWDAKMKTAEKDVGKWKGWTIKKLEARKSELMSKKKRSPAEQKEVDQLNFAIRAKHKGDKKWGKVEEAAVKEVAPPGKKAEDFIKKNKESFKKRYGSERGEEVLYRTAWKKFGPKNESYTAASKDLALATKTLAGLEKKMEEHRQNFKKKLAEGKVTDPLNMGYGIEGDAILDQMSSVNKRIADAKRMMQIAMNEGVASMISDMKNEQRVSALLRMKEKKPYGVVYTEGQGTKKAKMFESKEARDTWLAYKAESIGGFAMIDPETIDGAISSSRRNG